MSQAPLTELNGVRFLRLKGDPVERAKQHGTLLRHVIPSGALSDLGKKNEFLIRTGPGMYRNPIVQWLAIQGYRFLVRRILMMRAHPIDQKIGLAISRASGISLDLFAEAFYQPDALMVLTRHSILRHLLRDMPGCTSGVALAEATRDRKLLVARNMDYPIVGPWEGSTVVAFHEPSSKDEIPHVGVTTAGVHTAGLTSMNREGITLSTHAHFTKRVDLGGRASVAIANEIISRSKTIADAVRIAREQRVIGSWAWIIASAKENRAVVIEKNRDHTEVRESEDGLLSHSNYFHSPKFRESESMLSGACALDFRARYCQMRDGLSRSKGNLSPEILAGLLSDHTDPDHGESSVYGSTISVVTTIKSVIMEPESQTLWVSARGKSPVGFGPYLEAAWDQPPKEATWKVTDRYAPSFFEGIDQYREAYREWHMRCDQPGYQQRTLEYLRQAIVAQPGDFKLKLQVGLILFSIRRFAEARITFEEVLTMKTTGHGRQTARLYLARCLDLAGRRDEALKIYGNSGEPEVLDPKLKKSFQQGLRRAYRARQTSSMVLDLQFPDTLQD